MDKTTQRKLQRAIEQMAAGFKAARDIAAGELEGREWNDFDAHFRVISQNIAELERPLSRA